LRIKDGFAFALGCLTVGVCGGRASVDSAWGQYKLEARKMLENGGESHLSSAYHPGARPGRFVGWRLIARH